jgi:hypothetical protein
LPPAGVSALPTHGIDPFALGVVLEVPSPAGGAKGRPLDPGVAVGADAVRASEPTSWCGTPRATDDTEDEVDNGDYRFHAIYAVPSDAPDRLATVAGTLQSDAFQASALLERLYGQALRLDMGTSCGPQYLDISALRIRQSTADLAAMAGTDSDTFDTIVRDLAENGFPTPAYGQSPADLASRTNYLVWLDGPPPAGCGQASIYPDVTRAESNLNNVGGKVALVFRRGDGFCNSNAARHEMGHTLGALQQGSPHYDGSHCNETVEDTMCVSGGVLSADTYHAKYFDVGNDDYWSPPGSPLGWWTVDESRFLCSIACNVPGGIKAVEEPGAPLAAKVVTRRTKRVWSYDARVTGTGTARIQVTCARRGRTVRVNRVDVSLPARLRRRAPTCTGRPRVAVSRLG